MNFIIIISIILTLFKITYIIKLNILKYNNHKLYVFVP